MRIVLTLLLWVSLSVSASEFDDMKALAEQGYASAQFILGVMYENGQGTPQDYKEAIRWYKAAAEQGLADAQYNLALRYYNGQGTPQDYKLAHMWFNLAAVSGDEDAVKNRDIVAKNMTPADIAAAQQMASDWIKAHP